MSRKFDLIKIVKVGGLRAHKRAKIPKYWSKYSRRNHQRVPRTSCNQIRQHIMLIVLAQYVGSVERMLQYISAMDKVRKVM